jgi:hypothetical protein
MRKGKSKQAPRCHVVAEGNAVFVIVDGTTIAQRSGKSTWTSLKPGWRVITDREGKARVYYNDGFIGIADLKARSLTPR